MAGTFFVCLFVFFCFVFYRRINFELLSTVTLLHIGHHLNTTLTLICLFYPLRMKYIMSVVYHVLYNEGMYTFHHSPLEKIKSTSAMIIISMKSNQDHIKLDANAA